MKKLITPREFVLKEKDRVLKLNKNAFKGNTRYVKQYKNVLTNHLPKLTKFQFEAALGLVLSDASIRTNQNGTNTGLTLQQSIIHDRFLEHVMSIFDEYCAGQELPPILKRSKKDAAKVRELVTFKVPQFNQIAEITSDLTCPFPANQKLQRKITPYIEDVMTPVVLAYIFCGDGSRKNAGKRGLQLGDGKGVSLHIQKYSQSECELLSNIINRKLNFKTTVNFDYTNHLTQQRYYRIDFPGPDYELFVSTVGPYIHSSMHARVPLPRSDNSRFGVGNQMFVDSFLGTKVQDNSDIVDTYS